MRTALQRAFDKEPEKHFNNPFINVGKIKISHNPLHKEPAQDPAQPRTEASTVGQSAESPDVNIKLRDLQRDALKSSDHWQHRVVSRIGEIVNRPDAEENIAGTAAHIQGEVKDVAHAGEEAADVNNSHLPKIETPLCDS